MSFHFFFLTPAFAMNLLNWINSSDSVLHAATQQFGRLCRANSKHMRCATTNVKITNCNTGK
jgi:hypothetical protein